MARKPAPPKDRPEAKSSDPTATTEHPAVKLYHALNALSSVCSNAGSLRDLDERRAEARALQLDLLNMGAKLASDRANELGRAGAPFEQQLAALTEGMNRTNDPPPSNEPAEYRKTLQENILDDGQMWCERARAAMRAGGAKAWDAATHPNAAGQTRSIELHMKLRSMESLFTVLGIGLMDPRSIIGKHAEAMTEMGSWFEQARSELAAVMETRGVDGARARENEEKDHFIPKLKPGGYTAKDLRDEADEQGAKMSESKFRHIREASGIAATPSGEAGQHRRFSIVEIRKLAKCARNGGVVGGKPRTFRDGKTISRAWLNLIASDEVRGHQ